MWLLIFWSDDFGRKTFKDQKTPRSRRGSTALKNNKGDLISTPPVPVPNMIFFLLPY